MTATVPAASIVGMVVSAIVSIALPIVLAIYWRKKSNADLKCLVLGMATFVLFALVLESICHRIVLYLAGIDASNIKKHIFFYAIYGGLAAALFEETGRYVVMKFLMKNNLRKENSLMFGIGHGGIESIIILGATYIGNIVTSIIINTGAMDIAFAEMDEATKSTAIAQLEPLWTTPAYSFYMAGLERVLAIAFHICASFLVYRAVKGKNISFYLIAVLLHFAMDAGIVLLANVFSNVVLVELMLLAFVAVVIAVTRSLYIGEKDVEINKAEC
ncbi:YhfC family intramembrane metalloprotease [Butyrivibrio sp. VCB2006]|uniref:YhfC family intramembrane metalloprotease n=1 Tax=Butyrivibrio sp. VCB2006 TaxID=1280679 RepID=UPI000429EE22|nr:YhfC family glutamic-type intramembrane protease [Butyrivibrio sp. VCB2006]